jgi:hypothetical protein
MVWRSGEEISKNNYVAASLNPRSGHTRLAREDEITKANLADVLPRAGLGERNAVVTMVILAEWSGAITRSSDHPIIR